MLTRTFTTALAAGLCLLALQLPAHSDTPMEQPPAYPPTRSTDTKDKLHGATVADPYRWLEDEKSPEVKEWMAAQDRLTRDYLHKLPGREALARRAKELFYISAISAPVHRGDRYFYTRRHADREKSIVYWREGKDGKEQVLLDPNTMSTDGSITLGTWVPTLDGKTVAYALKQNNSDEATLYVMDVATGKVSKTDTIEGAKYAEPNWTPAGDGFYYTWLPTDPKITVDARPGYAEVRFHKLGTDPKDDPTIHPKTGNPETFISPSLSRDGRWLFVTISHGWSATDVYYRDLTKKDTKWQTFVAGKDALYQVMPWRDSFYIVTNDGAPRWRIYKTPAEKPARENWKEIVPEAKDAVIDTDNTGIVGEHLVVVYLKNASNHIEVRTLDGKLVREVPLPTLGSTGVAGNPDDDEAYYSFTSYTVPTQIFRTSIKSGETSLWNEVKLPIEPKPYLVEQVWYPSKDGTKISMFVVRRKDMPKDGSTPFLLTGYGGFNVNETPYFSGSLYLWLEAGGGFASPNLRGGGEYGEDWHRAGMLDKKQNVFDDFIGAAEFLVKNGYTKPERLAIRGGSNGGLLMGAALTQRPDLFRAVICEVPLLDMVRYHLFGSGRTWIPEYGSAENKKDFEWLYAYSPYHHVQKGVKYPAVLIMSADSDDRVDPMHARKMAALLQADSSSGRPVLLRIEKNAGHGGADLIKQNVEAAADIYAFLMQQLGVKPPQK
jgi:prolyl oligopeptidase